jgi:hypothetical protein
MMPLEKEMLGAIKAPTPPLQRMISLLEDIRAPEQLVAAAVAGLKSEQDPESRHPPFGKRLVNLGFTDVPPIRKVETSAIDQLLFPANRQPAPHTLRRRMVQESAGVGQRRQVIAGDAIWNENSRMKRSLIWVLAGVFIATVSWAPFWLWLTVTQNLPYDAGDIYVPWARW